MSHHQIVAVAGVVVRDGEILAMRRSELKVGSGLWETMSGRVEPDEDPIVAIEREIAEETGLEVRVDPRPVDAYAARRGDDPMIVIVFRADWVTGEVQRSDEHDAHRWLTPEAFSELTTLKRLAKAVRLAVPSEPA